MSAYSPADRERPISLRQGAHVRSGCWVEATGTRRRSRADHHTNSEHPHVPNAFRCRRP